MPNRKSSAHALLQQSVNDLQKKLASMLEINTTERELLKKILAVKNESLKIEHESAKLQQKQMALLAEQLDALEKHHEDDLKKIKLLQEMAVAPKRKERPASSFFSPTISSSNKDKKAIYPKAK